MKRVFLDTNILVDYALGREYGDDAEQLPLSSCQGKTLFIHNTSIVIVPQSPIVSPLGELTSIFCEFVRLHKAPRFTHPHQQNLCDETIFANSAPSFFTPIPPDYEEELSSSPRHADHRYNNS